MDALDNLLSRRSTRRFTPEPIAAQEVETLLRAGMAAPSAGNSQPWHFITITDRAVLNQLPDIQPHCRQMLLAPLAILVCADVTVEKHEGFWVQDCAVAAQNILLAAHAQGLGGSWCGLYPRTPWCEGVARLLNLPHHVQPLCLLAIGHPDEDKTPSERFRRERIHDERW